MAEDALELETLREAATALYEGGRWISPDLPIDRQVEMWEALRDALGLPLGHASELGMGVKPDDPPEPFPFPVDPPELP